MNYVAQKVGRRYFAQHAQQFDAPDPHYEQYVDSRGRTKSRKRELPPGLTKRDKAILLSVRRRAHALDRGYTLFGFKFGIAAILGLIPIFGDIACALLNYWLLNKAREADLPIVLSQRMFFNNAVALFVGLVPVVGDLAVTIYKPNSRNAFLLEQFLMARVAEAARGNSTATNSAIDIAAAQVALSAPVTVNSDEVPLLSETGVTAKGKVKKSWYGWGN